MSRSRLWTPLRRLRGGREVHFWHLARSFGRCEVCVVRLEAGPSRKNAVRKLLHVGVVVLQGVVIALAFDGDACVVGAKFTFGTWRAPSDAAKYASFGLKPNDAYFAA